MVNTVWLDTEVELVKMLHGVSFSRYDDENYTSDFESEGKETIVKVLIDKDGRAGKADLESVKKIVSDYDDMEYGEMIIVAKNYTPSASDYVNRQASFTMVTPKTKLKLGIMELLSAIQNLTKNLCIRRCGKVPETEEDCKGYEKGKPVCPVRCISDNADFHAEMGWVRQLRLDFENLVKVEKQTSRGPIHVLA